MYSGAHAGIQLVVTGEGNHGLREALLTQLKPGKPIGMPNFLASLQRAITQPSLLDRTTTGLSRKSGLKHFSTLQ